MSTSCTYSIYTATIEVHLLYNKETKHNQLSAMGMTVDERNCDALYYDTYINNGLRKCDLFVNKRKGSAEFTGLLVADMCNQGLVTMNGVDNNIDL